LETRSVVVGRRSVRLGSCRYLGENGHTLCQSSAGARAVAADGDGGLLALALPFLGGASAEGLALEFKLGATMDGRSMLASAVFDHFPRLR
jgi:hypothetical protein